MNKVYVPPVGNATSALFARIRASKTQVTSVIEKTISETKSIAPVIEHIFGSPFLTTYTQQHRLSISESSSVSVAYRATGETPHSAPKSVSSEVRIGETPWRVYSRLNGAGLNVTTRLRIIALQLATGDKLAFDLDALSMEDKQSLIRDAINGKTVIGHDLSAFYIFAMSVVGMDLKPAETLDTMIITRCIYPEAVYSVHRLAAQGNEAAQAAIQKHGNASGHYEPLTIGAGLGDHKDRNWMHPRTWTVTHLSKGHFDSVASEIAKPLAMLLAWTKSNDIEKVLEILRVEDSGLGGSYFSVYEKVPLALAKISHRGLPICTETLERVQTYHRDQIEPLAAEIIRCIPAMGAYASRLTSTSDSADEEMKRVLAAYAKENGCELSENDDGIPYISAKSATLSGAAELEGWKAWTALQASKRVLNSCSDYMSVSKVDADGVRKVHALISADTATLRLTSHAPNVMAPVGALEMPHQFAAGCVEADRLMQWHALQFRSIVGRSGHTIISADYSQIELRLSSAMAARAEADAEKMLLGEVAVEKAWVLDSLKRGADHSVVLTASSSDRLATVWRKLKTNQARPMGDSFRHGQDPHLLTGLVRAEKQGLHSFDGVAPVVWLSSKSKSEVADLKVKFAAQRKAAKPSNFGLLYFMQAPTLHESGILKYGIDWTLEEAKESRLAWFDAYPEIEFAQLWHSAMCMQNKDAAAPLYRENKYLKTVGIEQLSIGRSATLAGRPTVCMSAKDLFNHSTQGSGADILLHAVTHMSPEAAEFIVDLIHDEIVMCIPNALVSDVKVELNRAMLEAEDGLLARWDVPSEVEVSADMLYWS